MAADLSQLLRIDAKKHKYEKTVKIMRGCVSENVFPCQGKLCKGERSYRATTAADTKNIKKYVKTKKN